MGQPAQSTFVELDNQRKLDKVLRMQCFTRKPLTAYEKKGLCAVRKIPDSADTKRYNVQRYWGFFIHRKTYLSVRFVSVTKSRQSEIMHVNASVSYVQRLSLNAVEKQQQQKVKNIKHQRNTQHM